MFLSHHLPSLRLALVQAASSTALLPSVDHLRPLFLPFSLLSTPRPEQVLQNENVIRSSTFLKRCSQNKDRSLEWPAGLTWSVPPSPSSPCAPTSPPLHSSHGCMDGLSFLLLEHSKGQGCEQQHSAIFPASGLTGPGWAVVHVVSTGLGPANDFFGHVLVTLAAVVGTAEVPGTAGSAPLSVVAQGSKDGHSRRTRLGVPTLSQPLITPCCSSARAGGVTEPSSWAGLHWGLITRQLASSGPPPRGRGPL